MIGVCLALSGCGHSTETVTGTGGATTSSSLSAGGTGGFGGTTGSGGAMCPDPDMPITVQPATSLDCDVKTSLVSAGIAAGRIPGWKHPIAVDQIEVYVDPGPHDGHTCTLESSFTAYLAVGGGAPPKDPSAWTAVTFNQHVSPSPYPLGMIPTTIDIPVQVIPPGENLFVAFDVKGEEGTFCFGMCDQKTPWTWTGSSLDDLVLSVFQVLMRGHGEVKLDCGSLLRNNIEDCVTDLGELSAGPSEDGDLAIERLIPPAAGSVRTILFEMSQGAGCVLPDQIDLVYWAGDASAPSGSTFTEVKVAKDQAYRIGDDRLVFSVDVDPPLSIAAGQALYAGVRLRPLPTPSCIQTCGGSGAEDGQAWWGHTHLNPGEIVWKSLASEGFLRSYRVAAIYGPT